MLMNYALALSLLTLAGDQPEWGGFRGNNGTGLTDSAELPSELAKDSNALWRIEIPGGYSSPVIAGENVFVTAANEKTLLTLCLDRASGAVRWSSEIEFDGKRPGANSSAAPSPATDGKHVYALFHHLGLVAYDLEGDEVWRQPLGPFSIPHGMSTSPLVHAGRVIQLVDQDSGSFIVAFDKLTGKQLWKVERPGATHGYSTPAIYEPAAGPAQVVVSGALQIAGYSVETGEKVWWVNGASWQAKCVPVIVGDVCYVNSYMVAPTEFGLPKMSGSFEDLLAERDENGDGKIGRDEWDHAVMQQVWFIFDLNDDNYLDAQDWDYCLSASSSTGGLFAIALDGKGDVTETHIKWKFGDRRGLPDIPSPVAVEDTLFMIKEGGLLTSVNLADGEVVKQGRVGEPDRYFASPISAAGKLITASQSGQLAVISALGEWEVLSVGSIDEDVWATPAIAGNQVFVRSEEALYCFGMPSQN